MLEQIIALIAPHHCTGCGHEGTVLCGSCQDALPPLPSVCYKCQRPQDAYRTCASCLPGTALAALVSVTNFEAVAQQLVYGLKFGRQKAVARTLAGGMYQRLSVPIPYDVVCHAPTAPLRVRQRGYDQAALIARHVAKAAGLPYAPLLSRHGSSRQLGSSRRQRQQQMADVFRVRSANDCKDKRVLLVDDVFTTGATMEAAAAALQRAGAAEVYGVVFAQVAPD